MLRYLFIGIVALGLTTMASADRGLVTTSGPSGLFIHPTAESQPAGTYKISGLYFEQGGGGGDTNTVLASVQYGYADGLELGVNYIDADPPAAGRNRSVGGWVRYQWMRENEEQPSLAIGWVQNDGSARYETTVFGVAQKRLTAPTDPLAVHGYLGVIYARSNGNSDTQPYVGLDIQLKPHIKLVGEWSPNFSFNTKDRSAFGIHYLGSGGVDVGLAAVQDGSATSHGFFLSVGFNIGQ